MDFWTQYTQNSLQSPWFVAPHKSSTGETWRIPTKKVFVVNNGISDQAYEMLGKMVVALKYRPEEVSIIECDSEKLKNLEELSDKKRILFFGQNRPGCFGEALHWAGHQVIQTYDLQSLMDQPDLKRETWTHLKLFASLK